MGRGRIKLERDLGFGSVEFVAGNALKSFGSSNFYKAVDGRVTRLFGDGDQQIYERTHVLIDPRKGSAAGEDHAAIVNVGGTSGRSSVSVS